MVVAYKTSKGYGLMEKRCRKMKHITTFLIIALFLSSCEKKDMGCIPIAGYDDKPLTNGERIIYDDFYTVQLSTDSSCILTQIRKIDFIDTLIIVDDINGVYSFDTSGNKICKYGEKGHGRGEYVNISSMWVDKEARKICLLDDYRCQILKFSLEGKLDEIQKIRKGNTVENIFNSELISRDKLFASKYLFNQTDDAYSVVKLHEQKSYSIMSYRMETQNTAEYLGLHQFSVYDGSVLFLMPFKKEIYTIVDDQPGMKYIINTVKEQMTDDEISKINNFNFFSLTQMISSSKFKGFTDVFETKDNLLLTFSNYDYFLVDKKHQKGRRYMYQTDEPCSKLPLFNIISTKDDYFVGVLYVWEKQNLELESIDNSFMKELNRVISSMEDNSNPVLLFYKLKYEI